MGCSHSSVVCAWVLLLSVVCFLFNPCGVRAQTQESSRKQAIFDAIPQGILDRLAAGEPQELIVEFDSTDVEREASARRLKRRLIHNDRDIIEFKAQRFQQIKMNVLGRLQSGEIDVLVNFTHLPMAFLRLRSQSALTRLLDFAEVVGVFENRTIYPHLSQSLPLIMQPQTASAGHKGAGSTVAVIDTGVNYTRAEFGSCTSPGVPSSCKVVAAVEIATNDNNLDDNGHGTNVSAIVVGVAPEARLAVLDIFDLDGTSTSSLVISGINWAIANQAIYNIVALNMSLGDDVKKYQAPCSNELTNPFVMPINNARGSGILPVASSGNKAYTNGISSPACTPGVVSVGAVYDSNLGGGVQYSTCTDSTTAADKVTCFSNSASFLTMLAPGAAITAGGSTKYGTSQAAPHVAGSIAVLRAAYSSESLDATTSRLTSAGKLITDPRNGIQKPRVDLYNALIPYTLSVSKAGSGTGLLTSIPAGINCGPTCIGNFQDGTSVIVTASADTGTAFSSWAGCDSVDVNTCTIVMTSNRSVTATFDHIPESYTLTVHNLGSGSGKVSSDPTGISCGLDCTEEFVEGTVVTLTALAGTGSVFSGWTNCYLPNGNTCTVNITGNASVSATFTVSQFTLAVGKNGAGTVTGPGIDCGSDCTEAVGYGVVVTLSATPGEGYTFYEWTGCDETNEDTCTMTMMSNRSPMATFVLVYPPEPVPGLDAWGLIIAIILITGLGLCKMRNTLRGRR